MESIPQTKKKYIYSKEKIKQYNETYRNKHKDDLLNCLICHIEYKKFNHHYHSKTKVHKNALKINELNN